MKKLLIIIAVLMLAGCAGMRDSDWWEHDTQWASWDHAKFSLWGYKNPTMRDYANGNSQDWWGIPIEYQYDVDKEIDKLLIY